jgi:MFS family permease
LDVVKEYMTLNEEESASLKPFYARQILFNFSTGIISPFVSVYAVQLGASSTEMGWLRSLMNLFGSITQVLWGIVSDKLGRYVPAISIGGILSASLWLPLLLVTTPTQFILVVTLQAFATSIVTPAWASLIGKVASKVRRGAVASLINTAASIGSIGATVLSGYIMALMGGSLSNMYVIPIGVAAVCGVVASVVMMKVRETKTSEPSSGMDWSVLKSNKQFQTLCKVSVIHSFFMSISWPLFAITTVRVVRADMMQIAYISVISSVIAIVVRRYIGRITDRAGRRTLLILGRAGLFIYPMVYALATNVYHLFLANLISGIFAAISGIVLFAYQLDITREGQRGAGIALYNTLIGVATFFGSLFGGYLPALLSSAGITEVLSIQLAYAVSAIGRLGGGLLFRQIQEPTYPSTVTHELTRIVSEDIERAQDQLEQLELRGETVDDELQEDFDGIVGTTRKKEEN